MALSFGSGLFSGLAFGKGEFLAQCVQMEVITKGTTNTTWTDVNAAELRAPTPPPAPAGHTVVAKFFCVIGNSGTDAGDSCWARIYDDSAGGPIVGTEVEAVRTIARHDKIFKESRDIKLPENHTLTFQIRRGQGDDAANWYNGGINFYFIKN